MSDLKMGTAEARFADIIWEREPITSGQMAKIGAEEFNWKKSTSHTVLRRLCERGLFKNEDGTVTSLISREEYYARHRAVCRGNLRRLTACLPCCVWNEKETLRTGD